MRHLRLVWVSLLLALIAYGEGKHSPASKPEGDITSDSSITREPAAQGETSRPFVEDDVDNLMDEFAGMQGKADPETGEQPEKPAFEGLFD